MQIDDEKIMRLFDDTFTRGYFWRINEKHAAEYKTPTQKRKYEKIARNLFGEFIARLNVIDCLNLRDNYAAYCKTRKEVK